MKLKDLTLDCKSGKEFEKRVLKYLQDLGFTGYIVGNDDCGVDIIATIAVKNVVKTYNIQCKYYNTTIGKQAIHEVFSGSHYYNNNGIPVVITNNKMTMKALEFAKNQRVEVICEYELNHILSTENKKKVQDKVGLLGIILGKITNDSSYVLNAIKNEEKPKAETEEEKSERQFMDKLARKQCEEEEELRENKSNVQKIAQTIGFISQKTDYG